MRDSQVLDFPVVGQPHFILDRVFQVSGQQARRISRTRLALSAAEFRHTDAVFHHRHLPIATRALSTAHPPSMVNIVRRTVRHTEILIDTVSHSVLAGGDGMVRVSFGIQMISTTVPATTILRRLLRTIRSRILILNTPSPIRRDPISPRPGRLTPDRRRLRSPYALSPLALRSLWFLKTDVLRSRCATSS